MSSVKSLYRIKFDTAGINLLLLDWLDWMPAPLVIPWQQTVKQPAFVGADFADVKPLGGVQRQIDISRVVKYADGKTLQADLLARDVALPEQVKSNLSIRVLDLSVASTETEANRTHVEYNAAAAALVSMRAEPHPALDWVTYHYRVAFGVLALV